MRTFIKNLTRSLLFKIYFKNKLLFLLISAKFSSHSLLINVLGTAYCQAVSSSTSWHVDSHTQRQRKDLCHMTFPIALSMA